MKKRFVTGVLGMLIIAILLSGCAVSSIVRKSLESSGEEFTLWTSLFKERIGKMDNADIAPFMIWVVQIIGDDKTRLPREGEKLVDKIYTLAQRPEGYIYSLRERAELIGAWDRIFIILYEETGKAGYQIIQRLISAGIL